MIVPVPKYQPRQYFSLYFKNYTGSPVISLTNNKELVITDNNSEPKLKTFIVVNLRYNVGLEDWEYSLLTYLDDEIELYDSAEYIWVSEKFLSSMILNAGKQK